MPNRPQHRTLTSHLREWSAEQVGDLLVRRPDLARPVPPGDVADLAQRAQQHGSVRRAIERVTLPENRVLQLVVSCRPDVPLDELAQALPDSTELADLEDTLRSLEAAALVWRHDGRLHCSGTLRQLLPTPLGPSLHVLVEHQPVEYLTSAVGLLRPYLDQLDSVWAPDVSEIGPRGRPRKADLVDELVSLVAAPGLVEVVLASAPPNARDLASEMAATPQIVLDHSLHVSRYGVGSYLSQSPSYWLFQRALLLPDRDGRTGWQPREVGVALRGGKPVADLALERPSLAAGAADVSHVDRAAATQAAATLHRLADLLERWQHEPVKALRTGGLGVTVLKQVAALFDTEHEEAARIVELANLAGLLESTTVSRKQGRRLEYDDYVGAGPEAAAWLDQPIVDRWTQLATAWLRAEHWPGLAGRKDEGASKANPLLGVQYASIRAPERRREVLDALASLEPGATTTADALAASVWWASPQPWIDAVRGHRPHDVIGWVLEEAELLGIAATGALSTAGRALLAGDAAEAARSFEASMPEAVGGFTLQADLTATVVGDLQRDVLVELRLMADLESSGHASTWRFSDTSLRRALDAGRDAATILEFLEARATKGVPKPLRYLVEDAERRHGHLQVGAAASFVTSDDPAILADACANRRTRKLGLRLLAPTVAVSALPLAKVLDALRDAGFLPTIDGDEEPAGPTAGAEVIQVRRPQAEQEGALPEPFRAKHRGRPHDVRPVDADEAAAMAATILAGAPTELPPAPDEPDESFESFEALLQWALDGGRILALAIGTDDLEDSPLVMTVTGWDELEVSGIDLASGQRVAVPVDAIDAAADLGTLDDLADVIPIDSGSSRPRRGRRR